MSTARETIATGIIVSGCVMATTRLSSEGPSAKGLGPT